MPDTIVPARRRMRPPSGGLFARVFARGFDEGCEIAEDYIEECEGDESEELDELVCAAVQERPALVVSEGADSDGETHSVETGAGAISHERLAVGQDADAPDAVPTH